MTPATRRAVARVSMGLSLACLIVAALLFGRRDFGPATVITAGSLISLAGGAVYLRSSGRRS